MLSTRYSRYCRISNINSWVYSISHLKVWLCVPKYETIFSMFKYYIVSEPRVISFKIYYIPVEVEGRWDSNSFPSCTSNVPSIHWPIAYVSNIILCNTTILYSYHRKKRCSSSEWCNFIKWRSLLRWLLLYIKSSTLQVDVDHVLIHDTLYCSLLSKLLRLFW